ncbi:DUF4335 domain-containing protein [Ancylothrix sp. C2]|uniref:DUF4335 domain-containing protein n=1 Tax=Ancylothrix sp. D3o TaxID=2953691 RepID=UPI0021BAB807|nr:DUF4335 domain-containing protein [Ancylothrix sp. D3o]MCT7951677.1 DUF4335 domain-containing protein [Ancylothrix sp. D3o]
MIRQKFTPPTCTLEITANTSPLSQWAQQPLLKNLQFELHFDAPQLPEDMRVSVNGDRIQLEALYEAVTNYVQSFLQQSPSESFYFLTNDKEYGTGNTAEHQADNETVEALPRMRPASPEPALMWQQDSFPEKSPLSLRAVDTVEKPREFGAEGIYLQPKGALSHDLFLGSLANGQSGPVVNLGTLQLFDLASALEEYSAAVMALPNLQTPARVFKWPEWAKTAAVVVITAGVTAAVTANFNRNPSVQTAARQSVNTPQPTLGGRNNSQPQQIVIAPAPQPPPPPPPPAVQAPPEKLPKLPPMNGNPMQPLPTTLPGQPPLVAQNSQAAGGGAAMQIPPPPNNTLPSIPSAPPVVTIPDIPPPATNTAPGVPQTGDVATSRTTQPEVSGNGQAKSTPQPKTASGPASGPAASSPAPGATPTPAPTTAKTGELPPELPMVDLPENGAVASTPAPAATPTPENNQAGQPETAAVSDINVQIDQARDYFQERWKPPASLTQPLEYTLALNADGSIRQVLPRGLTSGRMIDITGMPLANEPFVSPVTGGEPPRIRLVLRPDGRVQTFLEPFKNDL